MDKLKLFKEIAESFEGIELKGKTLPYTSMNGNMFSFFDKDGELHLRLSPAERDCFLSQFPQAVSVQHGVLMKEYVKIHDQIFEDGSLCAYFKLSLDYAGSLKVKTAKKKRS